MVIPLRLGQADQRRSSMQLPQANLQPGSRLGIREVRCGAERHNGVVGSDGHPAGLSAPDVPHVAVSVDDRPGNDFADLSLDGELGAVSCARKIGDSGHRESVLIVEELLAGAERVRLPPVIEIRHLSLTALDRFQGGLDGVVSLPRCRLIIVHTRFCVLQDVSLELCDVQAHGASFPARAARTMARASSCLSELPPACQGL